MPAIQGAGFWRFRRVSSTHEAGPEGVRSRVGDVPPPPCLPRCAGEGFSQAGSGWAGGGGGRWRGEGIDRGLADEEAKDLAGGLA